MGIFQTGYNEPLRQLLETKKLKNTPCNVVWSQVPEISVLGHPVIIVEFSELSLAVRRQLSWYPFLSHGNMVGCPQYISTYQPEFFSTDDPIDSFYLSLMLSTSLHRENCKIVAQIYQKRAILYP